MSGTATMAPGDAVLPHRELSRVDTIFFLISAMVVVDTIGAVAIGGGETFTWLVILFVTFFIPSALASAELGAALPSRAARTCGCERRSAGSRRRSRRCSTGPAPRCGSADRWRWSRCR